jgi:TolA-binding protein
MEVTRRVFTRLLALGESLREGSRVAAVTNPIRMRGLLAVLAVLVLSLAFAGGCNVLGSEQGQALEEQKRKNEELQKQLDEQKQKEARRKEKEEEARQEELEQQVKDLQEKVEEQEKDQEQQNQESGSSSDSSEDSTEGGIENSDTSPSQATEGIVVVSSDFDTAAATAEEAEVINAAIEYYQYAEVGDYYSTYFLLSYEDQNYYTEDQWVAANKALDSAAGEFVVTDAYPEDLGLGVPTYAVTVTVYLPDGSSFNRTTYFVDEGAGHWAHFLSSEETNMFDDALY